MSNETRNSISTSQHNDNDENDENQMICCYLQSMMLEFSLQRVKYRFDFSHAIQLFEQHDDVTSIESYNHSQKHISNT